MHGYIVRDGVFGRDGDLSSNFLSLHSICWSLRRRRVRLCRWLEFIVFEAILVPFEMTACNVVIHFWSDAVPTGAIIAIVLVSYAFINMMAVKWYGEVEFWAAIGKVLLIIGLIVYTFVTMLGQLIQGQTNMRGPLLTLNRWQSTRGSIRFSLLEQSRLLQYALF